VCHISCHFYHTPRHVIDFKVSQKMSHMFETSCSLDHLSNPTLQGHFFPLYPICSAVAKYNYFHLPSIHVLTSILHFHFTKLQSSYAVPAQPQPSRSDHPHTVTQCDKSTLGDRACGCVVMVSNPDVSMTFATVRMQSVPAVTKDIFVWIVEPWRHVNYFNCTV